MDRWAQVALRAAAVRKEERLFPLHPADYESFAARLVGFPPDRDEPTDARPFLLGCPVLLTRDAPRLVDRSIELAELIRSRSLTAAELDEVADLLDPARADW